MSFTVRTTTEVEDVANFIANSILSKLKSSIPVLFFVSGGSCIPVCVKVAELLKDQDCKNLTIMQVDERYGPIDHVDSNWHQLIKKGFDLPEAKLVPILTGDDFYTTIEKFNENLAYEFNVAAYTIGLFGVGVDGHTAGILPESLAVKSDDMACGYNTPLFSRITITRQVIENLDEAIVFMQGKEKWGLIEDLQKKIDIIKQPAQILKKVPLLTIFTDYIK